MVVRMVPFVGIFLILLCPYTSDAFIPSALSWQTCPKSLSLISYKCDRLNIQNAKRKMNSRRLDVPSIKMAVVLKNAQKLGRIAPASLKVVPPQLPD
jgi:hypothetical protein